ncbi:type II toxin-antitoxin system Phd/YefM family antitoxin [Streptomyces sp. O3]
MGADSRQPEVVPLRALKQPAKIADQVADRGATIIVTRNGKPIMGIIPIESLDQPVYSFRTDPMGPLDIPDLNLVTLTDGEIANTLREMGGDLGDRSMRPLTAHPAFRLLPDDLL